MTKKEPQGWVKVFEQEKLRLGQQDSKHHHWWPRVLQKHWSIDGIIYYFDSKGKSYQKSVKNKRLGAERNTHTKVSFFENADGNYEEGRLSFESVFRDIDNSVPMIIETSQQLKTLMRSSLKKIFLLFEKSNN